MSWAVLLVTVVLAVALAVTVARLRRGDGDRAHLERTLDEQRARIAELETAHEEAVASQAAAEEELADQIPSLLEATPDGTLIDAVSGLYNEEFFRVTLEARVSAARRHLRPVPVVLLQVAEGVREGSTSLTDPTIVGSCVKTTLRDADTACRLDDGRFALVLEDTPE